MCLFWLIYRFVDYDQILNTYYEFTKYPRVLDFCCFWLTVIDSSFHSFMKYSLCTYYVIFGIIGTRDAVIKNANEINLTPKEGMICLPGVRGLPED